MSRIVPFPALSRRFQSLASKLLVLSLIALLIVLTAIAYSLALSWRLEGGAAAINDVGSLRMRSYRLAYLQSQRAASAQLAAETAAFDQTLDRLRRGDPARPLFLPDNRDIRDQESLIEKRWREEIRPLMQTRSGAPAQLKVEAFVADIDTLVSLVERDNEANTNLLRLFQMVLIAMALAGTVTMAYMLFLMVINPVSALSEAMRRLREGDLDARIRVDRQDEFGQLAAGFNQMAERAQDLYQNLESKVKQKTQEVEEQNLRLKTLYDMTSFLHQQRALDETCHGFLGRLMRLTGADAANARLVDAERGKLDQIAQQGLPADMALNEECIPHDACHCGEAVQQPFAVLRHIGELAGEDIRHCGKAGFASIAVFHIRNQREDVGIFTLYFREKRTLSMAEQMLIETLGQHLGVAIENQRLGAMERQFAVSEERNLMAQGLHDSIAQSLSFLNLQTQMLEDAMNSREEDMARENLAFIRAGVQECYEDVRELLLNFRTRISKQEFPEAVNTLLQRFEQQTRIPASLELRGEGKPLDPQQQLQVFFILQEALSNVRKHADASAVKVEIDNDASFRMSIQDNGRGFSPEQLAAKAARHVGVSIMQERANRIHSRIQIHSQPDHGTTVELTLPKEERTSA
ncbi:type IV pili methyl-accepting chemotaxis transducer N-terminal domain-containing protein [Chromobacterium sp. IIBBL 290-4]|uniref:type IV pili methyl-accepting chemotaxis transducer N-terminal domain-containing protein n=1 Tax=Chromobacterium sp. IIBBL 290-4 TaxID=2953890 RepID=UPI0020B8DD48|nr:type IV pili methyl-accepting chemotaxis transducer N-terminal domain-containing protein [Chromobacterium sp. IIBBL 290-4]UTH73230.1 type IV pili methyl-accepting chemotaxis transducer N-terminal domain-containing protein [Chromobacterium sp. IIBBL 290-4]